MGVIESSVVCARVSHTRRAPVLNRFSYGVDYLLLNEAACTEGYSPKLFSYGSSNLVSLHPADHGVEGCRGFEEIRELARKSGIEDAKDVLLLTHPRYFGYTFNPVSFWFVMGKSRNLRAVIAEVHNTFGDRHSYICKEEKGAEISSDSVIIAQKCFHVSPFFDIVGEYRFRFLLNESRIAVQIVYDDGAGGGLDTTIAGNRLPFTDRELALALLRRPFGAARTTGLIHWQALRLWLKGVRYRRRPKPPERSITW